jgi:hypothetical protein
VSRGASDWEVDLFVAAELLPMLPHEGTEKFVSHRLLDTSWLFCALCCDVDLLGDLLLQLTPSVFLSLQLRCAQLNPAKTPLPEEVISNQNKAAVERRRAARKAQHKECEIVKRDRNDNRIKRRKAGERGVSSNEDPSSKPSWSSDVASAVVDWSDMSGSSSSSPPRAIEVSSLRCHR